MTERLVVHVVPHSHWDREWYHTAERFRQRLVAVIDELLDDPPGSGETFLLDGQAVILDDYLAVRPERAAELAVLLRDGRLEAGPWYVLADGLIPGGEALVRNLLAGRETMRRLRADAPPVLYCPDSFGHPASLPELASGFGFGVVVVWRGYGGARWPAGDTAWWSGPSGARALLYHLPPDGYEFGSSLPTDLAAAADRWARVSDVLGPRASTGVALLLNGADHHARQRAQGDAVGALARVSAPAAVVPSSLAAFAEKLLAAAHSELPRIEGELRDSYGYTWTLQGTLAARAVQKRANARAERLLVRDVEPWLALAADGGGPAARSLLRAAWRTLLLDHPHDTLCGTSIDAVARAFDHRWSSVMEQGRGLRADALASLAGHDAERARATPADWRPVVMLRNPVSRARGGVAELRLTTTVADVSVGPGSAERQGSPRPVPPWRVEGIPLQLLSRRERVELTEAPRSYPDADRVAEVRALGWVSDIAGYAIETRAMRAGEVGEVPVPVRAAGLSLDNGLLTVRADDAGCLALVARGGGIEIPSLLSLECRHETGDLYTPAAGEELPPPRILSARVRAAGPLRGEIVIEAEYRGHAPSRRSRCRLVIQLDAGLAAVRVVVHGDNRAGDVRLRLRIHSGLSGASTIADAAFYAVRREPLAIPEADARMERVVPTAPLHRWVSRYAPSAGLSVFSDGLAEYESASDGSLAITLLRAVDALSRHDLPERPGHAGWPAPVPNARSLGRFRARLAVAPHGPDSPAERDFVERLADDVLLPITGETLRSNLRDPATAGGLTLEGEGLVFGAAAPAQAAGWVVLRCVNRGGRTARGRWTMGRVVREAARARLDETPEGPLSVCDGTVEFTAAPYEIVTILVR